MPPVVVGAAIGAAASTAVGYYVTGTIVASAIASSFATSFAISLAGSIAMSALAGKPSGSFGAQGQGVVNRDQMVKQAITNRRVVYGTAKVSGPIVFMETTDNDKYLHMAIVLAAHEVTNIFQIYIDDEPVGTGNINGFVGGDYKNKIRIKTHFGSPDQVADPDLVAESNGLWTNDHRLQGVAYVYVRLEFDQDVFPNGIPNISAMVHGKEVYDVRDDTTHFSTNPALCIRDYLLDTDYGLGVSTSEINNASFITAANECDELVNLAGEETDERLGFNIVPYTTEYTTGGFSYTAMAAQGMSSTNVQLMDYDNRYTMNGTFDTNQTPKSIIENMLTSLNGTFTYTAGEFALKAASYIAPSDTLTQDILRSGVSVKSKEVLSGIECKWRCYKDKKK